MELSLWSASHYLILKKVTVLASLTPFNSEGNYGSFRNSYSVLGDSYGINAA